MPALRLSTPRPSAPCRSQQPAPPRPPRSVAPAWARPLGLALGVAADAVLADPARWHPVAGFGRAATAVERRVYADRRDAGAVYTAVTVGSVVAVGATLSRLARRNVVAQVGLTAAATWAVVAGAGLAGEGTAMAGELARGDLAAARRRVPHLCARDPAHLDADGVARATVESLAENASDAVVAPLLWGAVAGIPGLLGYRAVNTLDAMVGYRSPRYRRFGWASARLDDVVNLVPARVTALLTVLVAPLLPRAARASGSAGSHSSAGRLSSAGSAWRVWRRDAARHPSPNAGHPEAAAAGALGVRLGGRNAYDGYVEERPALGDGPTPSVGDVRCAVRLVRLLTLAAAMLAAAVALALGARLGRRRGGCG